jgi:hypothetical protein
MSNDVQPSRTPNLPIEVLTIPFVRFAKMEASNGLLLLAGTSMAALVWSQLTLEAELPRFGLPRLHRP